MCNLAFYAQVFAHHALYISIQHLQTYSALQKRRTTSSSFFSFFFSFLSFIYTCVYWSDEDSLEGKPCLPSLLTKIHIFLIYMSQIPELEDTSAKKRTVGEIVITDSKVSISQCWAILKNICIQPIMYAIYCLKQLLILRIG